MLKPRQYARLSNEVKLEKKIMQSRAGGTNTNNISKNENNYLSTNPTILIFSCQ